MTPWERPGRTTFYFVDAGIEPALDQAREAAGDRDVRIAGGGAATSSATYSPFDGGSGPGGARTLDLPSARVNMVPSGPSHTRPSAVMNGPALSPGASRLEPSAGSAADAGPGAPSSETATTSVATRAGAVTLLRIAPVLRRARGHGRRGRYAIAIAKWCEVIDRPCLW